VLAIDANHVHGALAFFHRGAGIVLRGAASEVADSTATGNRVGFRVDARATLTGNFASANERDGYLVAGSGGVLTDNRALGIPFGFTIFGSANRLERNESRKNLIGVFLDGRARSNTLLANVVNANTVTGDRRRRRGQPPGVEPRGGQPRARDPRAGGGARGHGERHARVRQRRRRPRRRDAGLRRQLLARQPVRDQQSGLRRLTRGRARDP
jgi:hypothetical protein